MGDLAAVLATHVADASYDSLPNDAILAAKKLVLNTLSIALSGHSAVGTREAVSFVRSLSCSPEATVLGTSVKTGAGFAAYANASSANAHDFDDNFDPSFVHVGPTVVASLLAVAEARGPVNGRTFITGVALGADVICRLASCRNDTRPMDNQWHSTGVFSHLGCSAAVAKLLTLPAAGIQNAMGIAFSMTAGTKQCLYDGAPKAYQMGNAAKAAVLSGMMSEHGILGATNLLEGPAGFFPVYYGGRYAPDQAVADLGERYLGSDISLKPYPSCRFTHGYIDAVIDLVREHAISADQVERVTAHVCERNRIVWDPSPAKETPRSIVDAQFSVRFAIANALVQGSATLAHYSEEGIRNPQVLSVLKRVELSRGPDPIARGMPPVQVDLETKSGKKYSKKISQYFGSPAKPMSLDDLARKFRACAPYAAESPADDDVAEAILAVQHLEDEEDVGRIAKLLGT